MVTCYLRYVIDPYKLWEFEKKGMAVAADCNDGLVKEGHPEYKGGII